MRKEENRMYFVNVIRDILLNEKNSGNREKKVLKNNLCMLNDLIKIGVKYGLGVPSEKLILYFLNRLTGWVNFYLYANSKNMRNALKYYKNLVHENLIATSYCVKKYFHEYDEDLLETLEDLYGSIQGNTNLDIEISECKIYAEIYDELCMNFKNSYTGGVIDALNYYYDLYIKDWVGDEVGRSFRNLCMPIYTPERYLKELDDNKLNKESLKKRARYLFETILEKQDPSAVLNVLRTSFDDNVLKLL